MKTTTNTIACTTLCLITLLLTVGCGLHEDDLAMGEHTAWNTSLPGESETSTRGISIDTAAGVTAPATIKGGKPSVAKGVYCCTCNCYQNNQQVEIAETRSIPAPPTTKEDDCIAHCAGKTNAICEYDSSWGGSC